MNLSSAAIVLRERTGLELVDLSLRYVRALAPLTYLRLSAVVLLPLYVGCLALRYVAEAEWGFVWFVALWGTVIAQPPFTLLAGRLLFSDEPRVTKLLVDSLRRAFAYGALLTVRSVLFFLSAVTFVGPIVVWMHTAYLHEILYLENASFGTALGRSRRFVSGRSGSSLEMLFLVSTVIGTFVLLAEVLGQVLVEFVLEIALPVDSMVQEGGSPFALAGLFAAVPFTTALRFLFYVNERTLRDAWDVQVRFLGIRDGLRERLR